MENLKTGDIAYLIESSRFIREGRILSCSGGLYLFRFIEGGATKVKAHRLFATEEEAQAELDRLNGKEEKKDTRKGHLPYDVGA